MLSARTEKEARLRLLGTQTARRDLYRNKLTTFGKRLGTTDLPVHALRWAEEQFEAAGFHEVADWIIGALGHNTPLNDISSHLLQKMRHQSRDAGSSTSQTSNLMDRYLGRAYAQAHRELEDLLDWIED